MDTIKDDNDKKSFIKKAYRLLIPFFMRKWFYNLRNPEIESPSNWSGNYSSWEEAMDDCEGYDAEDIFEKVSQASLKVKRGEAAFERDSVLFEKHEYNNDFLEIIQTISSEHLGNFNVLDFGGSLGSVYFQYKPILDKLNHVKWNVVEQKHFVDFGTEKIESVNLKFYYSIEECQTENKCKVALLSSVISYVQYPFEILQNLKNYKFEYIIIDKTLFSNEVHDHITKQVVPEDIYEASYPCRVFSKKKLITFMLKDYDLIKEFDPYNNQVVKVNGTLVEFRCLVFKIK